MTRSEMLKDNKNAVTHGAYAFKAQGEKALKVEGRTRLAELREQAQDRDNLLALMQEKCADSVLLFELVQSHVASEAQKGIPLSDVKALRVLPQFMNSMQRALATLISLMPDDSVPANAELDKINRVFEEYNREQKPE